MGWKLKLDPEANIIVLILFGKISGEEFIEASNARVKLAEESGVTNLLVDAYKLDFKTADSFSVYQLVDTHYKNSDINRKMNIAITTPKLKSSDEMVHFYETVCINRGHNCKKFKELKDAVDWLTIENA